MKLIRCREVTSFLLRPFTAAKLFKNMVNNKITAKVKVGSACGENHGKWNM